MMERLCGLLASSLSLQEQENVQYWLLRINVFLVVLIAGLIGFAVAIRYVARATTQPCHWCMEFISKKESICPRCGKKV